MRKTNNPEEFLIVVCNFTPKVHHSYRIGVPATGYYQEVFNSDEEQFGGSGQKNTGILAAEEVGWHDHSQSLTITVPPLATIYLKKIFKQVGDARKD